MVDLSDHILADLDRLLEYLYTGEYSDPATESADAAVSLNANNPEEAMPSALSNDFNHDMKVDAGVSSNVDSPQEGMPSALPIGSSHDPEGDEEGCSAPLRHARMYAIGDRYDISPLKDLAKSKFGVTVCRDRPSTDIFLDLIEYVHTSTPDSDRGLRDPIQEIIGANAEYFLMNQEIIEIMLNVPTVAVDMCKGLLAWAKTETKYRDDQVEYLNTKYSEDKWGLERITARNSLQMKDRGYKLERCKTLVELLWSCDGCRRKFSATIADGIIDPLEFDRCDECQLSIINPKRVPWKKLS